MDNPEIEKAINEFFHKYKAAMWRGEVQGILNARDAAAKDLIERLKFSGASTDPEAQRRFKEIFFERFLAYLRDDNG